MLNNSKSMLQPITTAKTMNAMRSETTMWVGLRKSFPTLERSGMAADEGITRDVKHVRSLDWFCTNGG